jgi:hypothetical protein
MVVGQAPQAPDVSKVLQQRARETPFRGMELSTCDIVRWQQTRSEMR